MGLKEPFNSVSHMIGGGLAVAGLPFLFARAQGPLAVVAVATYGFALGAMFTLSAVYHAMALRREVEGKAPAPRRRDAWLFRLDRVGIYLLIAGTYTPVALVRIGGALGWTLFGVEWAGAAAGIALALTVHRMPNVLHQLAFLLLGWAALTGLSELAKISLLGLSFLVGGGILYSGGAFLYARDRPQTIGRLGDHEVWHLLVVAGAAAHFWFVATYVL